jgi:hypothetical protein
MDKNQDPEINILVYPVSANTGWALTDIKDEGDELLDGTGEGGAAALQGQLPVRHLALLYLQRVHLPRNLRNNSYLCTYDLYGQCCGSGSGAFLTLDPDPGSGIGFFPDPGSQPIFFRALCKKFYNSLTTGPNFFLQHLKNKIIFNFVQFLAKKKV